MNKVNFFIAIATICLLSFNNLLAQKTIDVTEDKPNYEYFFERIENVSLFVAPISIQIPLLSENINNKRGFGAAVIVNKEWYIGYYNLNNQGSSGNFNNLSHNGLWLGYIFAKNNQVHLTPSLKLGSGSYGGGSFGSDNVFVMNPQIGVEANLFKWAKAEIGLGYQFVSGLDNFENDDLQGLYIGIDLKVGWFANPLFGK